MKKLIFSLITLLALPLSADSAPILFTLEGKITGIYDNGTNLTNGYHVDETINYLLSIDMDKKGTFSSVNGTVTELLNPAPYSYDMPTVIDSYGHSEHDGDPKFYTWGEDHHKETRTVYEKYGFAELQQSLMDGTNGTLPEQNYIHEEKIQSVHQTDRYYVVDDDFSDPNYWLFETTPPSTSEATRIDVYANDGGYDGTTVFSLSGMTLSEIAVGTTVTAFENAFIFLPNNDILGAVIYSELTVSKIQYGVGLPIQTNQTPEPSTIILFGFSLLSLAGVQRRINH
ncbi:MAG: PEP-CTERM sorting domain-containing protein [Desulfobacterales bacterium]|nr:PEP-CTERM sorting domain-containing protein [Desulfobacterales bacterium]